MKKKCIEYSYTLVFFIVQNIDCKNKLKPVKSTATFFLVLFYLAYRNKAPYPLFSVNN